MTPEDFAIGLTKSVVDDNLLTYRELLRTAPPRPMTSAGGTVARTIASRAGRATASTAFEHTTPDSVSDSYWRRALVLYHTLTPDQQVTFLEVIRQVVVDTTSNVLGVIDGVSSIEGGEEELTLIYGRDQKISGDLQSLFLAKEEQRLADKT